MFFMQKKASVKALVLAAALSLTGCQTLGGGSSSGVDSRLTSGRQAEFFSKSGWQACAVGATAATAVCLLSDASNKLTCSAIAAIATCGILMGTNYYLEQQRVTYANKEDRLNAYIKDVNNDTEKVKSLTNVARNVLAQNQQTLVRIDKQIKSKNFEKANASRELAEIDKNLHYLKNKLSKMKEAEKSYRDISNIEARNGLKTAKLNQQINLLHNQIVGLERQVASVSKRRAAIKLG